MPKKVKSGLKGREELKKQIEKKKAEIVARHQVMLKLKRELADLMDQRERLDRALVTPEFLLKFLKSLRGWEIRSGNPNSQEVAIDFKSAPKELQMVRRGELRIPEPAVNAIVHFSFGPPGFVDMACNPDRGKQMIIKVAYSLNVGVIRILQKYDFGEIRENIERREIDILDDKVKATKAMLSGEPYLSDIAQGCTPTIRLG